jgi:hypothetical protein
MAAKGTVGQPGSTGSAALISATTRFALASTAGAKSTRSPKAQRPAASGAASWSRAMSTGTSRSSQS